MGVFNWLCANQEPTAIETYAASSRSARGKMMVFALARYEARFLPNELLEIRAGIKALDKLAPMRNQIAHGHVSHQNRTVDGVQTMTGNFLVPALNEFGQHIARDPRYAHTAIEIDTWREKVRDERWHVVSAWTAAIAREQALRMTPSQKMK